MKSLIPGVGHRRLVFGRSRTGKSAFQEWTTRTVAEERPSAMQLLVDTKPRFRAETERMPFNPKGRRSAAWRYKGWQKGPVVPNSVVADLDSPHPFRGLFKPGEIVILQSGNSTDWRRMLILLTAFVSANIGDRERRLVVDEVLDFYQRNTFGIDMKHDVFYRTARAGGERGIGLDLGAHRVYGLPPLIIAQMSSVVLFHLGTDKDMRYLQEYGIRDNNSPQGNYVFRHWNVEPGGMMSDPFTGKCVYPQSYLDQLAAS